MVVEVGLTVCVPPLVGRVYELPSVPVIVTRVAFVAVTLKVDELFGPIDVGFATMLTVGAGFAVTVTVAGVGEVVVPPGPVAVAV